MIASQSTRGAMLATFVLISSPQNRRGPEVMAASSYLQKRLAGKGNFARWRYTIVALTYPEEA